MNSFLDCYFQDSPAEIDARDGYFNRLDFGDKGGNCLIYFGTPGAHENDRERALQLFHVYAKITSRTIPSGWIRS